MESIIDCLVKAGYYRARVSTISDFDKIIGGMAWAMQSFSYDINMDVFYADSLDLGQKIALTERMVMVLLASKCPYRIEPHQIVGLDYDSLLPVIGWLIKRCEELRREHEAFNRLLALRHYHRVTNRLLDRSTWCHIVHLEQPGSHQNQNQIKPRPAIAPRPSLGKSACSREATAAHAIITKINETYKDNDQVSFVKLATLIRASNEAATTNCGSLQLDKSDGSIGEFPLDEDENEGEGENNYDHDGREYQRGRTDETCFTDDDAQTTISDRGPELVLDQSTTIESEPKCISGDQMSPEEIELHQKLDLELLATNQKILNLLKKLDSMPSHLEIRQYQTRYVELHQQLIAKNKSVKKLFDLYNSLDVTKHYLEKELNLLESISKNLDIVNDSDANRNSFMQQFNEIVSKILNIRDDLATKAACLRDKCNSLNDEYDQLLRHL